MPTYFNINYEFCPETVRAWIDSQVRQDAPSSYVCVADGNILQMVQRDKKYRNVINGGMFSLCDSSWVPLYLPPVLIAEIKKKKYERITKV